jgi:hypothetical protein
MKEPRYIKVPAKLLKLALADYEHCAPDAGGRIDPWRRRVIRRLKAVVAKAETKP